jgi:hypothetical protein
MYGNAQGVGAYCRNLASAGSFTASTNPTLSAVESWLEQISSMLDSALAVQGFVVPLVNENAVNSVTAIVEQIVADMAKGANSTGRFFAEKTLKSGTSMWQTITDDLNAWVVMMAPGLEGMGAERGDTSANTIGYAEDAFPIFQRDGFGNTFTDWEND